jgi:hypothetical protein
METLEALQKQARAISDKIGKIESAKVREKNRPKVGKFYRARNNYSCPEKRSDYWWVYAEVTRMDEFGMLYATEIQTDRHGNISIRFDSCIHHAQSWSPTTRYAYVKAWAKMLAKVKGLVR